MTFYIPIILPYSLAGKLEKFQINIPLNCLGDFSKHKSTVLNLLVSFTKGQDFFDYTKIKQFRVDAISNRLLLQHQQSSSPVDTRYTLTIEDLTNIKEISSLYSPISEDIFERIIFALSNYLQSLFLLFGPIRISPIIVNDDRILFFNNGLAYLYNPWQIWFFEKCVVDILYSEKIFEQISATKRDKQNYNILRPYLLELIGPFNVTNFTDFLNSITIDHALVNDFGSVISMIIRAHPSYDHSLIIGLLTAFIEKLLKINNEHRYKFKIKISNLLESPNLSSILGKIYDSRSQFFHTAKCEGIQHIYDIMQIYFLLLVCRKLLITNMKQAITENSFDFINNFNK